MQRLSFFFNKMLINKRTAEKYQSLPLISQQQSFNQSFIRISVKIWKMIYEIFLVKKVTSEISHANFCNKC